jgi:hypothetical protein
MELVPFSPESLKVEARLEATSSGYRLTFELSGEKKSQVIFPEKSATPKRKNELWKQTCFECFLSMGSGEGYFEFNGSPSGDWALYSFDSYRSGMKEVPLDSGQVPVLEKLENHEDRIACVWTIPLFTEALISKAGVTAVVVLKEHGNARTTYWALRHSGQQPDFHLKESFIHRLF